MGQPRPSAPPHGDHDPMTEATSARSVGCVLLDSTKTLGQEVRLNEDSISLEPIEAVFLL